MALVLLENEVFRIFRKAIIEIILTFILIFIFVIFAFIASFLDYQKEIDKYEKSEKQVSTTQFIEETKKKESRLNRVVRYIKVTATAYTAGEESTGKKPSDEGYGITASGTTVKEGRTIACSPDMMGKKVYVKEMDNTYICEDTGSAITKGKIDIYFASLDDAVNFGRRIVNVSITN